MNGPYFGPCTTIRQYRDRDQSIQNGADAELEAARREADSFSFGPRQARIDPRGSMADTCQCKQPNIKTLSFGHEGESGVNKLCLNCGTHWYGPDSDVKRLTRKEWDDLMNTAFSVKESA